MCSTNVALGSRRWLCARVVATLKSAAVRRRMSHVASDSSPTGTQFLLEGAQSTDPLGNVSNVFNGKLFTSPQSTLVSSLSGSSTRTSFLPYDQRSEPQRQWGLITSGDGINDPP